MSNQAKKTTKDKKSVAKTSMISSHRGTLNETRKTISGSSRSLNSISSQASMSTLAEENEQINLLQKDIELYEEEYCNYILQALRSKMVQEKEGEREKEVKECLVSLKTEFQQLLTENEVLYEKYRKIEVFQKIYPKMEENLLKVSKLLKFTKEIDFEETLKRIKLKVEESANRLKLIDVTREEIDQAFSKNLIGFDSDIYKLVKMIEDHVADEEIFLPEIVEILKEIRSLHAENEELKIRCTMRANQLRRENIASSYEKYFQMAIEECKDILEKLPNQKMENNTTNEFLQQATIEWGNPTSSSTPTTLATAQI